MKPSAEHKFAVGYELAAALGELAPDAKVVIRDVAPSDVQSRILGFGVDKDNNTLYILTVFESREEDSK